mmetsp:Transcript_14129/g.44546  ORF Transcript_14129/g.44546 Transcript_14129/m.44546 type:complete len:357 (+) Transcript_14129:128-1198(+)
MNNSRKTAPKVGSREAKGSSLKGDDEGPGDELGGAENEFEEKFDSGLAARGVAEDVVEEGGDLGEGGKDDEEGVGVGEAEVEGEGGGGEEGEGVREFAELDHEPELGVGTVEHGLCGDGGDGAEGEGGGEFRGRDDELEGEAEEAGRGEEEADVPTKALGSTESALPAVGHGGGEPRGEVLAPVAEFLPEADDVAADLARPVAEFLAEVERAVSELSGPLLSAVGDPRGEVVPHALRLLLEEPHLLVLLRLDLLRRRHLLHPLREAVPELGRARRELLRSSARLHPELDRLGSCLAQLLARLHQDLVPPPRQRLPIQPFREPVHQAVPPRRRRRLLAFPLRSVAHRRRRAHAAHRC